MTELPEIPLAPKPGRARQELFRRLVDVVVMPPSRIAGQDRAMVADILLDMLFHADEVDRIACAERLARIQEAPRRIIRYLGHCAFPIARPLLTQSEAYDAVDLSEIAESGTPEHRLAIAARKMVPASVADTLCRIAEPQVIRVLLKNQGAVFPEQALDALVMKSREHEDFCPLLLDRHELRPAQAMTIFWWADGATRRKILLRHAADRLEVIERCQDVFQMAAAENWQDPIARKALQLIERRQRNRAAIERSPYDSLEDALNAAATLGMSSQMAQEIGYLAGIKPVTAAKILSDPGGEGLAVLCKATGLHRDFIKVLWAALKRPFEIDAGVTHPQFKIVADTYEILTVAKAQTVLRYWNWSLSSAFSPKALRQAEQAGEAANEDAQFSNSQRTAKLVFGR